MVAPFSPDHAVPHVLRAIKPHRLLVFLHPFRDYFRARGLELPPPGSDQPIPYDRLVEVLLSPDADTPQPLAEGLACTFGLGTPEMMPSVLLVARDAEVLVGGDEDLTPADLVVQLWLQVPHLLERLLAEQSLGSPREFAYYRSTGNRSSHRAVTPDLIAAVEGELAAWFDGCLLGRAARLFVFPRPGAIWFLVRHGEPYRREACSCGAGSAGIAYRPLTHDTVVYCLGSGELRVHARLDPEKDLYRRVLGRYLFGREDYFIAAPKFTLEPLRESGESALRCGDVFGLEWVTLREVHYSLGGAHAEHVVVCSGDVFASLRDRGTGQLPSAVKLLRATFELKVRGASRPRHVTVAPPNVALYDRDEDVGLVEEWLSNRGFFDVKDDDRAAPPLLASA